MFTLSPNDGACILLTSTIYMAHSLPFVGVWLAETHGMQLTQIALATFVVGAADLVAEGE